MSDETHSRLEGVVPLTALLGYLNFSEGRPEPRFQRHFADAFAYFATHGSEQTWVDLHADLHVALRHLQKSGQAAFAEITQADQVLVLGFDHVLPAYRRHHRDLLAHLDEEHLWQPFFLVRVLEAVLHQGGPWQEVDRIVAGSVKMLNDFVGHRPVAVLENRRRGEVHDHERVRPIPLFLRGAGMAFGPFQSLVEKTLEILENTSKELLAEACFDPALLDELALDPRGYDFGHPVDKRPNYVFGEWDPHHLDNQSRYRRYIVRQVTLEGLRQRVLAQTYHPYQEELLFEAAAVLAGTILMASGVSGSGPHTHDSSVTLATLIPRIARCREGFYHRLLDQVKGTHGQRLRQEAQASRQPFGGARQHLNQHLGRQRALHLQRRHLALLLAEMGYPAASRRQVTGVAAVSVRMLADIHVLLTTGQLLVERGELHKAAEVLPQVEDLLRRGIGCGALVDPWNILGFAGQFPRFTSMEDSIRDGRIDDLVRVVDQLFNLYARVLSEGAAAGTFAPRAELGRELRRLADWWDAFATTTVSDIQHVDGAEANASAEHVATALARWRERGGGAADLAFWREQLDRFQSPKSFALVVEALLRQNDLKASLALLMTWLEHAEQVPLEEGDFSFHQLALRWMLGACSRAGLRQDPESPSAVKSQDAVAGVVPLIVKFFDSLEANAQEYWEAPRLQEYAETAEDGEEEPEEDEPESLYEAAYEGVTYQDTTDDDVEGEVLDFMPKTDFDLAAKAEDLEKRLRFLATLARLWNIATRVFRVAQDQARHQAQEALRGWLLRVRLNQQALLELLDSLHSLEIPKPSGSYESLVEFDNRRLVKERMLNLVLATCLDHILAVGALRGSLDEEGREGLSAEETTGPPWEPKVLQLERALLRLEGDKARQLIREFIPAFRSEPLLYNPLGSAGHPRHILRASLAQTILRGLSANLPRQGLLRETYMLVRLAHDMEQAQSITGPRITEFDRLFQLGLQAVIEAVADAAVRESKEPASVVQALEGVLEPFLAVWMDHSRTLRVAVLEGLTTEKEWTRLTEFIQRYGKDLFNARFLALGNLRAILHRGAGAYLDYLQKDEDAGEPIRLIEDLDKKISRADAERLLQTILQAIVENYDHYRDYNATTTQSDFGENLFQLCDFLRLKASYERNAWQYRPLALVHEVLARRFEGAADLWRQQVQLLCQRNADEHLRELDRLEKKHGIRLTTIRDRLEERFIKPLAVDRLVAMVEPAVAEAAQKLNTTESMPFEEALRPFAESPSGVGLDVPSWIMRLESELFRVKTTRTALVSLAENLFQVPRVPVPFDSLPEQLKDWKKAT